MFWFDFAWDIQHLLNQFWWEINFLLLILTVVLGYLGYKKPNYGLGLLIILLPTYLFRSKFWLLPFTFLEVSIWILFASWTIGWLTGKNKLSPIAKKYGLAILLILAGSTIGLLISPNLNAAAGLWKAYFVESIMVFLLAINILADKTKLKPVLWSLGISSLTVSLLAIYQKFSGFGIYEPSFTNPEIRRVTSFFSSPNAVGLYLGPIVAIYFGWIISEFKNYKSTLLKTLVVLLAAVAIVFTKSIGTALGLAAAVIFMLFFGWNKKITSGLVIALIITALAVPASRQLLLPILSLQDASGQNRLELWALAFNHLLNVKNFFLGLGILNFSQIQDLARDPLRLEPLLYPHNFILNFWVETGLIGLAGIILVIVNFFRNGFKALNENYWLKLGIMAAMVTILIHGLIDVPYFKNDLAVLFWLIIALL